METKTCRYCNKSFDNINPKVFSNHVRWCPENHTNGDKGRSSVSKATRLPRIDFIKHCLKCGNEFHVERLLKNGVASPKNDERSYCSLSCANGHEHSQESKEKIRQALAGRPGTKKPKIDIESKNCPQCQKEFRTKAIFCSVRCARQYQCRDLDKTTLRYYRNQCAFKFALNDFPDEFDFALIEEHGWYSAKNHGNNLGGVSRDHIVSVRFGFDNAVSPEIISHPANCKLMVQSRNSSKHSGCDISLEELVVRIEEWNKSYP